jgi:predicted DCC family thiol-disulfide oxidoreductase YuxK
MHSFIYLRKGEMLERSTAALNVAKDLGGLWHLLYGFILIPVCWRDVIYTWIAKNRYRWFGRKDECMIPEPGITDRFFE